MKRALAAAWRHVGFVSVAVVLVYCVVHAFDPPRLNWGDSGSDYNVMTAGRNFQKYGFLHLRLTPYLLDPAVMSPTDSSKIYTHYPQLPDLANGVMRVVFGFSDIVQFRLVALGFSFGALGFVYALLVRYWGRRVAQLGLALWVINPLWIQHADYLHHGPYGAFFGFGSVFFLTRYLDERRARALWASGTFLFLAFLSSYDFWFFAPLLIALVTVGHYGGVRAPALRLLGILAAFGAAAIIAKLATNAWALGGAGAVVKDFQFQLRERSTNPRMFISVGPGIWPTMSGRIERCFTLLLFPIAALWAVLPLARRRWRAQLAGLGEGVPNPWWLLLAALPFLCVFVELWISQYYPGLLVLPFYAVASALLVAWLLDSAHRWAKAVGTVLMLALVASSIDEDLRFPKAYFDRGAIQSLNADLGALAEPGQYLLVNHVFDFFYHYYFNHPVVDLIINQPSATNEVLAFYTDPVRPQVAPPRGAIFVQHKHLADQMFDKGLYYVLARDGLWDAWGSPERYRSAIDSIITARDSMLAAAVARIGHRVAETDAYVIWRLTPRPAPVAETRRPAPRN